jgi:uncharacterized protein YqeY
MGIILQVEQKLSEAQKSRDQVTVATLRGLKSRIQNEQIAKGKPLQDADILQLIRSEIKRRKEASGLYREGGREELASKEEQESKVLEEFLPTQISSEELENQIQNLIDNNSWTSADFGKAMGSLKQHFGDRAEGSAIAAILKEKLNS